ncbi:MAG: anaerobic glycerol-3-phosphate dehydrogenase subunit GlpB [Chloroflexota bacterium]|nr:anaerobic glycerol-3-phosphate dehydrogenase subunit GlpB [Chloroflexota bacterium]
MPSADVVVIGAGLAGLTAAVELAERGASVHLAAKGMAATHWAHGGLDVAAVPGTATSAQGVARLRAVAGHPYAFLDADVAPAVAAQLARLAHAGLTYRGDLETALRPFPTPIGGLRPAAIVPSGQAAALDPWTEDEGLLLIGIERFRDFWPQYAARNLARQGWPTGPARIESAVVALPGLETLRNLNSLVVARHFDDATWRAGALAALRGAVPEGGRWRIGLPAVLGLEHHPEALDATAEALGHPVFEIPTLPPSIPGLRLFEVLRARARELGVTALIGFEVAGVERDGDRIVAVETHAAARPLRIRTHEVVLATGGIGGGGLRGRRDGGLDEPILGLSVVAPERGRWLEGDLYGADGVALEAAGIRVDDKLRPLGPDGEVMLENVRVVGSALAGMRYLAERCGDGVAIASGYRAARLVAGGAVPKVGASGKRTGRPRRSEAARKGVAS